MQKEKQNEKRNVHIKYINYILFDTKYLVRTHGRRLICILVKRIGYRRDTKFISKQGGSTISNRLQKRYQSISSGSKFV